jgi:nicotinate phosphoribosyltransferase
MHDNSVFSLFTRKLPKERNYLLFVGLDDVLHYLENLRFSDDCLDYLSGQGMFKDGFLDWLRDFRFTGDVHAMPEGTPFFEDEPVIEVSAPISQAQLFETFIMNQVHHQSVIASKASRVVQAAGEAAVVDFGLRRMHGADAGVKAARAFEIAGVKATSNVFGGYVYNLPISGTMAHSYIQAHDEEIDAFRAFADLYPDTILLVDTYDTLDGVRKVLQLAEELGDDFKVSGVRLDSGDLTQLAFDSRKILDDAGLTEVSIFASGGLNEYKIKEMMDSGAPVSGLGVGTDMGVSADAPYLDMVYKLVSYSGEGRLKTSPGKGTLPGRKQIFRVEENGRAEYDIVAGADEEHPGRPLIRQVMKDGKRMADGESDMDRASKNAEHELSRLPKRLLDLEQADEPYEVRISQTMQERLQAAIERVT